MSGIREEAIDHKVNQFNHMKEINEKEKSEI